MNARNETRKHLKSVMKTLVIALAVTAGMSGSAWAAGEDPSFTGRAQVAQGLTAARGDSMIAYQKANIPDEAASFFARVRSSQGIASGTAPSAAARWIGPGEAQSFITRAQLSQGVGGQQGRS
jgi:hypothetical protein